MLQRKGEHPMPSLKTIDNGKAFDWGKVSSDYAKQRDLDLKRYNSKEADKYDFQAILP